MQGGSEESDDPVITSANLSAGSSSGDRKDSPTPTGELPVGNHAPRCLGLPRSGRDCAPKNSNCCGSGPFSPFESMYNPRMQGIPWRTITVGSPLLISICLKGGQEVQSPQPEKSKPPVKIEQRGRILGIGGVFFKSANRDQMREWYSKHLGLADKGQGVMLPWREHDDPQKEHVTVWTVFPTSTKYFDPSQASFMVNYIVDDLDALLDRLKQEGVKIDAKRMDESYGRFAWIYDLDGNKIELWQPLPAKP